MCYLLFILWWALRKTLNTMLISFETVPVSLDSHTSNYLIEQMCCCFQNRYSTFRKLRKGHTTWILVNLCVSLICVSLIFFVADAAAQRRLGCLVCNALRLFLVLVSLMWNGVEAVNMYLKLVRVFNTDISYFVQKAAAVAWGRQFNNAQQCAVLSSI